MIDRCEYVKGRGTESYIKSIVRVNRTKLFSRNPHYPEYKRGYLAVGPDDVRTRIRGSMMVAPQVKSAFIMHAVKLSLEEWVQKRSRGYADRKTKASQCVACRGDLEKMLAEYNCKTTYNSQCVNLDFPRSSSSRTNGVLIEGGNPYWALQQAMHAVLKYDHAAHRNASAFVDRAYALSGHDRIRISNT